jgi:hypothetical protein
MIISVFLVMDWSNFGPIDFVASSVAIVIGIDGGSAVQRFLGRRRWASAWMAACQIEPAADIPAFGGLKGCCSGPLTCHAANSLLGAGPMVSKAKQGSPHF